VRHTRSNHLLDYENQFTAKEPVQASREKAEADWIAATAYSARLSATEDPALIGDWYFLRRSCPSIVRVLDYNPEAYPDFARELPAAAKMFIYAAAVLLKRSKERDPIEGYLGLPREKWLWKGADGLSPERWIHWKERWRAISETGNDDQKKIAKEALAAITEAEKNIS
jgi:hypothetical protein